jgi:NIMA (never in mitosis gene a)-related kinase 2
MEREAHLQAALAEKDAEILSLRTQGVGTSETHIQARLASAMQEVKQDAETRIQQLAREIEGLNAMAEARIRDAVARREEELRVLVLKHEEGVAAAMQKREEELMDAVRRREEDVNKAWIEREQELQEEWMRKWRNAQTAFDKERETMTKNWDNGVNELKERVAELEDREREVDEEWERLFAMRKELKEKWKGEWTAKPFLRDLSGL